MRVGIKVMNNSEHNVEIREAGGSDAKAIIDFYQVVGGETDFLSFGKGEFKCDVIEYKKEIEQTRSQSNSIMLLALIQHEIVGIATIHSSQRQRSKHSGTLGIVVAKAFAGRGIGKTLMNELLGWASTNGMTRKINLATREDNAHAIKLYKQLGFEQEGVIRKETFMNERYYDTIMMGLFL